MIRHRRITLAALTACMAIAGIAPRAFSQNSSAGNALFLWKVSAEGGGEAWLFGSIHAGTKEMYPLPDAIEKAFAGSKKLVVEADVENLDPAAMQALIFGKGIYPPDDSLSKHLKKETIDLLKNYCAKNGIPFEAMERTRPWLVGMMIASKEVEELGMDTELGLDKHFLKAAKTAGKQIIEIEGVDEQLGIIASLPDAEQEASLVVSLTDQRKSDDQFAILLKAWKSGDAAGIDEISRQTTREHPETKPVYDKLLDQRNDRMAEKIEGYLKTKEPHFVVVGALHLVGEKGIVKQLEAKKYKVEQIKGK